MQAQKEVCLFPKNTTRAGLQGLIWVSCTKSVFFPFLFGERDIFFGNGIEAPFMLFYFNLLSFF